MSPEDRSPFEEDLSAYLDGELDADREAELRAELARDPQLAARLEALRAVDERLRAAPAPAVPGDLRARLQARIDAAASRPVTTPARGRGGAPPRAARGALAPLGRRWRAAPLIAAAALAAAIVLVVLGRRPADHSTPERVAEQPAPAPTATPPGPNATPTPGPVEIAAPEREPARVAERAPATAGEGVDLDDASDEELEIAMDWRLLDEDLEMIEQLELLEKMLAREKGRG